MNTKRLLTLFILAFVFLVSISAQVKTELFEDKTKVKTTPMELPVVAQLELFVGFPELQSKISEFFFKEKNVSIREAYQSYLEKIKGTSLINPKDPKEIVTGRLFDLHKAFEKDGVFVCFEATKVETQSYAGNKSMNDKSICILYDILHKKVLTLDDIFNPNTAKYIKGKLEKGDASSIFIDCGETDKVSQAIKDILAARKTYVQSTLPALHYGNRYQIRHMDFDNNRKYFTSSFNELVDALLKDSGTSHSSNSTLKVK